MSVRTAEADEGKTRVKRRSIEEDSQDLGWPPFFASSSSRPPISAQPLLAMTVVSNQLAMPDFMPMRFRLLPGCQCNFLNIDHNILMNSMASTRIPQA